MVGHLQDFSEAADALGALNLSEGWSSLSLRSRHSESGAQDSQLRAERGDPFETSRSRRANVEEEEEEEEEGYPSAQTVSSLNLSRALSCQQSVRPVGRQASILTRNTLGAIAATADSWHSTFKLQGILMRGVQKSWR